MDTTRRSSSGRHQPTGIPPSPRLPRSRSITPATKSPSQIYPAPTSYRSRSTTKSRTSSSSEENFNHIYSPITTTQKKNKNQNKETNGTTFAKFWQSNDKKMVKSSPSSSPSAWALSPGRSLPVTPKISSGKLGSSGGVSGVLKYFRQRKVIGPTLEEVGYKEYGVSYNRLLQWRFVNARAEVSLATVNMRAQKKMFNVWLRILLVRNSIMEMRIEMEKLKSEIKVYKIINSQYPLLKEWKKMEGRNCESVGRVIRKLSATSTRVPLLHGATVNMEDMNDAMSLASMVLANIISTITRFHSQVERICYLLTELTIIEKQEKEFFDEVEKNITVVASFRAVEKSLRVQVLQLINESRTEWA